MELKNIKKILIINFGGIGDVLLSLPALKALRSYYPEAEISVLVANKSYEVVKDLSFIDEVFTFAVAYGGVMPFNKMLTNFWTLLSLRKKRFDLAVNMRTLVSEKGAGKIKFILAVIGPGIKAGRDTEGRGNFYDIKIPETDAGLKYEMEYDVETVNAFGINVTDRSIDFAVSEENIEKVNNLLKEEGISNDDVLIGIHPGGMPSRRWPLVNFSKVIKEISSMMKCKFVVTGGNDEIDMAGELVKTAGSTVVNMAGKLNIKETGALIKRCNAYIANDTGTMHIAAVLKTPLAAILGPGDMVRFNPINISDNVIVLYKKTECAPCDKKECGSMKCLKAVSVKEVTGAVHSLLNRTSKLIK
jgi:heptosyltransferase-2/heptosyltransferase-3